MTDYLLALIALAWTLPAALTPSASPYPRLANAAIAALVLLVIVDRFIHVGVPR